MLWAISYGTVEYAWLLPGGQSPRFSNAWKPMAAGVTVWDKTSAAMTKEAPSATIGQ